VPLRAITAKALADAAIDIFSRMCLPLKMLTDRGTQFVSVVYKPLTEVLRIDYLLTRAYHFQSNGVLEHLHATAILD